jgi:hypothetical protein
VIYRRSVPCVERGSVTFMFRRLQYGERGDERRSVHDQFERRRNQQLQRPGGSYGVLQFGPGQPRMPGAAAACRMSDRSANGRLCRGLAIFLHGEPTGCSEGLHAIVERYEWRRYVGRRIARPRQRGRRTAETGPGAGRNAAKQQHGGRRRQRSGHLQFANDSGPFETRVVHLVGREGCRSWSHGKSGCYCCCCCCQCGNRARNKVSTLRLKVYCRYFVETAQLRSRKIFLPNAKCSSLSLTDA